MTCYNTNKRENVLFDDIGWSRSCVFTFRIFRISEYLSEFDVHVIDFYETGVGDSERMYAMLGLCGNYSQYRFFIDCYLPELWEKCWRN